MIVEILGAKMLAPYVGMSHFVWTAQIAVTLVALAAGYYAGGRMVDRSPKLGRLTAISTLGSFAGTVLIGYLLIPFLPNSRTMYFTAVLLMLVVCGYFFGWERKSRPRPAVLTGTAAGLLLGLAGVYRDNQSQFSE